MNIAPDFWVRVLLCDGVKTCVLKSDRPFDVSGSQSQISQSRFNFVDIPLEVGISGGKIAIAGKPYSNEVIISPDEPYIFNLNGSDYRGKLKLIINPDSNSFDAINLVPLEPYLAGVIGAEMPDYWEPEALKAQAIAARTYCLYMKKRFGDNRHWDVSKTQASQVYRGVTVESAQIWDAVEQTKGKVLTCIHPDGTEDIFPAFYSSTCGGHTENSQNVFGGESFGPLTGVRCPYCKYVAKPSFFFWPMVKFDKKIVEGKLLKRYQSLNKLGKIAKIIADKQSNYKDFSRITNVKVVGSTGKTNSLRAEDLRLTIDPTGLKIKSAICKIIDLKDEWAFILGRGYGHGVGMCQCGAQGMAREGKNARQILFHYYPGSKIVNVY